MKYPVAVEASDTDQSVLFHIGAAGASDPTQCPFSSKSARDLVSIDQANCASADGVAQSVSFTLHDLLNVLFFDVVV